MASAWLLPLLGTPRVSAADDAASVSDEVEMPRVESDDQHPGDSAPTASRRRPSPLDVELGMRVYGRAFHYVDAWDNSANKTQYVELSRMSLPSAPMPFVQGTWYPAAHFTDHWLAHIGFRGGYQLGIATDVLDPKTNSTLHLDHSLWSAGLRARVPLELGEGTRLELGFEPSFAEHRVVLTGQSAAAPSFPDLDYKMIQLGSDAELRSNGLIVGAEFQYLLVTQPGTGSGNSIDSRGGATGTVSPSGWFPGAQASGVDFGGWVGWEFSRVFDVLAGVDFRAYGLGFSPLQGSAHVPTTKVAGGATDQYVSAWAAVRVRWPEDEAPAPPTPQQPKPEDDDEFDSFE